MAFFASVAGLQVVGGSLMIPLNGAWTADLQLAGAQPISGSVSVVIGNLTLAGFVYRAEPFGGQTRARLIGGAGGWRQTIPEQGYGTDSGVLLSHVLNDAASACGENVASVSGTVGNAFTRIDGPASDVLWQLVSQGFIPAWHIDPSGTTQVTPWPSSVVSTPFTVTGQRPDEGVIQIATEDYASWLPGCTFTSPTLTGSYTNGGVLYNFDNDGQMRFEVMTDNVDRLLGPLTFFIGKQVAPMRFYGRYGYTIDSATTTTVNASPKDSSIGLPALQNVPIDADSISTFVPPTGVDCHITFLDGIPTQPICVWTAGTATVVNLDGGSNPVARLGDQVQCFLPPTLPVVGTVSGSPFVGTITVANPITGVVTQGSSSVNSA